MKRSVLTASMLLALSACNEEAKFQSGTPSLATPIAVSPKTKCEVGKKLNDVRIAFLVDVSGSNALFDCRDPYKTANGITCASTAREESMNAMYDSLNTYIKELPGAKPTINFALATYPSSSNQKNGAEIQLPWTEVKDENKVAFSKSTESTRYPNGWTPIDAGYKVTKELFAQVELNELNKNEDRIITVITDGEQTPEDKDAIQTHINELKLKYNVKNIIVLKLPNISSTNGNPDSEALKKQRHQNAIKNYVENSGRPFWLNGPSSYDEKLFEEYYQFGKNITKDMASSEENYFELSETSQLLEKLNERLLASATCIAD